jgi:hypothetical protein
LDSTEDYVLKKFAAFENERDPELIQEALESIEVAQQEGDEVDPKEAVSRWLSFFAALDRNIDRQWDPEDVPVMGVIPPVSEGVAHSPGVDPSKITDPAARQQYEQDLKANWAYAEHYRVQHLLRRIDERAMHRFERLLAERYKDSSADRTEVEELVKASPLSDGRKQQLLALVP